MRNIGLDIARSLAILMVIVSHSRIFFTEFWDVQYLSINGLLGVELFFVLSGFLIGGIIIRDLIEGKGKLIHFYLRRWLRTIPAYYLVLTILVVISIVNHQKWYFENFLFIQNFNYRQQSFFGVSWSLSIEEWFYLLVPPCLLIITYLSKDKKKAFFGFCICIITLSLIARAIYTYYFNPPWDAGIRKQIYIRLDSLMFGVVLAGIRHYYKEFYDRINARRLFLTFFALIVAVILYYIIGLGSGRERMDHSFIGRTVYFDVISFAFMLMIWSLEKSKRVLNIPGVIKKFFTSLSAMSYSLYLVHREIFMCINEKVKGINSISLTFLVLFITCIIVFALAYILHRCWEQPFMNLRDKYIPKDKKSTDS